MLDLGNGVRMYRRSEWGARPPRSRSGLTPSYGTTGHWEGPHMGSFPHSSCAAKIRAIQNYHMDSKGWQDIAYTVLYCPHGYAFEGRWTWTRTAANGTNLGNNTAYAACYLGGEGDPFTAAAQKVLHQILWYLDAKGGAGPGRNCHRNWKSTACPGDVICNWIRTTGQTNPTPPSPTPIPPKPVPTGDAMTTFFFNAPGKEYRLYDGGVIIDMPPASAVRDEFIKVVDSAHKDVTGEDVPRRTVSAATWVFINNAGQNKQDQAPGFIAEVKETGKRVWVQADRGGKISEEVSPDEFGAVVWVMTSQGFDLTPQEMAAAQLDDIPET